MRKQNYNQFHDSWLMAHAMSNSNQTPSDDVVMAVFDLLEDYPIDHVIRAIKAHSKKTDFAPTPSKIIALLETKHKHVSADEAWSICPKSDFDTTVWTGEIAEAFAACYDLLVGGDKIGARMAFKGAYERICNVSELQGKRPSWIVSIGDDKAGVEAVINKAVSLGRISQQQATNALPPPEDSGVIGKLLTGKVVDINSKSTLDQIRKVKKSMADAEAVRQQAEIKRQERERDRKRAAEDYKQSVVEYCESEGIKKPANRADELVHLNEIKSAN